MATRLNTDPNERDLDPVRREAMAFAGIGLYRFTFDGTVLFMDGGALRIFGLEGRFPDPESVTGKNIADLVVYLGPKGLMRKEVTKRKRIRDREWSFKTLGGEERWVVEDCYLVADQSGQEAIQVIVRDITEQKRVKETLREREEKYRTILDNIHEGYYEVDLRGNFTFVNKAMCRILGYSESEMIGLNYRAYYRDEAAQQRVYRIFNEVYSTEKLVQLYDWEVVRKDGSTAVMGVSVSLMHDAGGKPMGFRGIARDITQQKEAEKALHGAEARNRALLNAIPDVIVRVRRDGVVLDYQAGHVAPPGARRPEDVIGTTVRDQLPAGVADDVMAYVDRALETRSIQTFEFQTPLRGEMHDYEVRLVVSGEDEALAIIRDISNRKRAEQALRESEERYRELFENANDIVYTHDFSGRFTSLNKAGEEISGYSREEALRMNAIDITPPEHRALAREMVQRKIEGDPITRYEIELTAKDGRRIPVEVSTRVIYEEGKPVGIQGIARDITERRHAEEERRRLEAQIQHAQKLEGLGVLAGGIAHDFNNLLVGMLGYAGLALTKLPPGVPARGYVEKIEFSAQRAAELTNQMLAYSGRGTFVLRPINLFELVEDVGRLLSASVSKKATLRYHCAPDLPAIVGDPAQVNQVIMNLITNASDALGDEPGVITLSVTQVNADRPFLARSYLDDSLPEGRYVCLEISDTGCGMDKDTLARIFDPFFSTKFAGRGLGLAAVLGIVRGHKGAIRVYSEPGKGTTFKVLLPAAPSGNEPDAQAEPEGGGLRSWRGTGVILVADDEEAARSVAREVFEDRGFDVLTASDGLEAVEVFRTHADEVSAVLLDLTMPVMGGKEAFEKILEIRPSVPVILSSGYTERDATTRFVKMRPAAFVQKPYVLIELVRKLHDVLAK
jgi:PAS domain S-box-containing protein